MRCATLAEFEDLQAECRRLESLIEKLEAENKELRNELRSELHSIRNALSELALTKEEA